METAITVSILELTAINQLLALERLFKKDWQGALIALVRFDLYFLRLVYSRIHWECFSRWDDFHSWDSPLLLVSLLQTMLREEEKSSSSSSRLR
jgi:hypothetical protein